MIIESFLQMLFLYSHVPLDMFYKGGIGPFLDGECLCFARHKLTYKGRTPVALVYESILCKTSYAFCERKDPHIDRFLYC